MTQSTPPISNRLKSERIQNALRALPGWEIHREDKRVRLRHEFPERRQAVDFLGTVMALADDQGVSPRLVFEDRTVEVAFPTTRSGGVKVQDLTAARSVTQALTRLAGSSGNP